MKHSTTKTYTMKREILRYAEKIYREEERPERKFGAEMAYGILASGSCLLTDISNELQEKTKKINTVDRLSRHLSEGSTEGPWKQYLQIIQSMVPKEAVILVDDSDVVKPEGYHFEALGTVRDGSESTEKKNVYKKGYHVTEAVVLTHSKQPVSIYSRIHSSEEKGYQSVNAITMEAIERGAGMFGHATFIMDRGYDDNKMFQKLNDMKQDYVIRLTSKRNLYYHGKWTPATQLRDRRKGKIRLQLRYHDHEHIAYLSHVKVQITASKKPVWLVLVYGITEHPMMLATNKSIRSKQDAIHIAKLYFSRWRIEEYFRCKKNAFRFEEFRVRKLKAINALNFSITICMTFLAYIASLSINSSLRQSIMEAADPIKNQVCFLGYRFAAGIARILDYAHAGVRDWFKPLRLRCVQLSFNLTC